MLVLRLINESLVTSVLTLQGKKVGFMELCAPQLVTVLNQSVKCQILLLNI